ncbi:uncharacterized protein LOC134538400 [Bacillus rossius redtenbacheri]|uniref:uncharacterized protein LOC134538400 n=1 Tax=Bacillus rossius redtenbacheri TaxID=93214 RepID=UPI002FDECBE8
MDRHVAGPSWRPQVSSQASLPSTVTQRNKRKRLSLGRPRKSSTGVVEKDAEKVDTDVVAGLRSPPKIFSQVAVPEVGKLDTSAGPTAGGAGNSFEGSTRKHLAEEAPEYCPICQMPFKNINILPSVHAAQCDVKLDELPECSKGENCSSTSVFHYRDYAHRAVATRRSVAVACDGMTAVRPALTVPEVKRNLSFDSSNGNSSSTKSLGWLQNQIRLKQPSVLCAEPIEISSSSDVGMNNVPPEKLPKTTLPSENSFDDSALTVENLCENAFSHIQPSRGGNVETCRVPCGDTCFDDLEFDSDDSFGKPLRASLSVTLSPDKNGKVALESPVKIQVSCGRDGWDEVGFDSCAGANIGSVKVTVCECSKSVHVDCVVGDGGVSVNQSSFKLSTIGKGSASLSAAHDGASGDGGAAQSVIASPSSSKTVAESSSHVSSSSSMVPVENATEYNKENVVGGSRNASARDQWQRLMPRARDREPREPPAVHVAVSGSSVSTGSVYKSCPHYKRVPDTSFAVDAFKNAPFPGITTYFLTHFHADHYGGLRKSFNQPIYCSSVTAALVRLKLRVDEKYIRKIDIDETRCISGVLVTALDANHCPGSLMFLFQLKDGRNFLHVGDFRADPKMESYPCFWNIMIDRLYLDTTYCHPKHTFPPQYDMIAKVVDIVNDHTIKVPKTLIVCGTYTIGKEKVFMAIAELLDCKLWARADKRKVLECIRDPDITRRLTSSPSDAQVHVCPMGDLNFQTMSSYLKQYSRVYNNILAFKPSGWELRAKGEEVTRVTQGNVTICGVPYSEHSSFCELKRFVKFLKPKEVFPTVNLSSLGTMQKYFKEWLSEQPLKRRSDDAPVVQTKLTKYIVRQTSSL